MTSGAKTTTQASELIFGYASVDNCVTGGGTGFTIRQTSGCNMSEDMIASATGTYSATFTQGASGGWAGLMATFKAAPSGTGIAYAQSSSNVSFQAATGLAASFTSNTTAGNAIVVAASTEGSAISSVTDTQGNTYVQALTSGSNAIWYATSIKGGADTVTAIFAASTGFSLIYIHEYSGLATVPVDQVSSQSGTGTAVTSGAKTTTQASELLFGYASVDHCVLSGTSGFSVRQTAGCNMSEDMIVSATGTYSATFTQNVSSGWTGLMVTFKAASSGPPPTLVSIAVTPANPSIATSGSPLQMTATGTYSDSSQQNITNSCTWTSNATGIATVNSSGQVTGVASGSAKIICTVGSVSGFTTVTVTWVLPLFGTCNPPAVWQTRVSRRFCVIC